MVGPILLRILRKRGKLTEARARFAQLADLDQASGAHLATEFVVSTLLGTMVRPPRDRAEATFHPVSEAFFSLRVQWRHSYHQRPGKVRRP